MLMERKIEKVDDADEYFAFSASDNDRQHKLGGFIQHI